ncbi:MAG: hypothetical protein HYX53_07245 [Chloroflexi bacterium]|nr:hypothetical protein [Chloroflexota bacterium]
MSVAFGHHRHQYYYHFASYPGATVAVYRCSPVSASAVQTVVANYNANGGIGTTLSYGGDSCTSATGIVVKEDTGLGAGSGYFQFTAATNRAREIMKDSTQLGRVYYQGVSGQYRLSGANAVSYNGSDKAVIAHEIGHGLGLLEHYVDVTGINNCANPSVSTVMDCSGADTGPLSHDAADLYSRWSTSPWGTGAIWITNDAGAGDTAITLNWADINDNETSYSIYKNGSFLQYANADAESANITGLSGGECFYLIASNGIGTNTSSQICRSGPSAPSAPSGASISVTPNNYTALLSWTTNASASAYTHEFVTVYAGGSVVAQYYVPNHGTGAYSQSITLGQYDSLPATYSMEVYTCNAKYNAWSGFGCVYGTSASAYLSYP